MVFEYRPKEEQVLTDKERNKHKALNNCVCHNERAGGHYSWSRMSKGESSGEGIHYTDVGQELLCQHGSHQPLMAVFII